MGFLILSQSISLSMETVYFMPPVEEAMCSFAAISISCYGPNEADLFDDTATDGLLRN